ncbi:MAG: ABC transporter ATP-binding protein/permease [Propionibacteriaceae bacterium]|nr:ABC transporter ATP-binding protein/permease [Propionibacteriaceae bacterium]
MTISGAVSLVSVTGIVLAWNPLVAVLILISPILPVVVGQIFAKRSWLIERERAPQRRRGQYLLALVTNDKTYKETRLLGLVPHFIAVYHAMQDRFLQVDRRVEAKRGIGSVVSGLVGVVVTALAIMFAIQDAFVLGDVGRLAACISAGATVTSAAQMLMGGVGQPFEHTLFLGNLFEFLDLVAHDRPSAHPRLSAPVTDRSTVVFDDVTFRYPGQDSVALSHFSASFAPGCTVALVGANGAGKSTIVKLLARLYEPTSALDAQAEEAVFDQLRGQSAALKILISHRFSTVRMADEIVVLSQGQVIERGDHGSLLDAGGVYAQMYAVQARAFGA